MAPLFAPNHGVACRIQAPTAASSAAPSFLSRSFTCDLFTATTKRCRWKAKIILQPNARQPPSGCFGKEHLLRILQGDRLLRHSAHVTLVVCHFSSSYEPPRFFMICATIIRGFDGVLLVRHASDALATCPACFPRCSCRLCIFTHVARPS